MPIGMAFSIIQIRMVIEYNPLHTTTANLQGQLPFVEMVHIALAKAGGGLALVMEE